MSDIKIADRRREPRAAPAADAASRIILWLERHIREKGLAVGDALPGELDLAREVQVGRSSVREALIVLKVLGIIRSHRKGGIRIVRDPVLLELRHFFASRFATPGQYKDALEFRAALEWGLGPMMLARVTARTVRALRGMIKSVAATNPKWADIGAAEIRFHTALTATCGNRLATLFAHLYGPIFAMDSEGRPSADDVRTWVREHQAMMDALAARDEKRFLKALKDHTHGYIRLRKGAAMSGRASKP